MDDIFLEAKRLAQMQQRHFIEDTRLEARDALALIVAARDLNPEALIPTPLMVAIEAARNIL